MSELEFIKYIESIGFEKWRGWYIYQEYIVSLYTDHYNFYSGYKWYYGKKINDFTLLQKEFKQELRYIKLKKILG